MAEDLEVYLTRAFTEIVYELVPETYAGIVETPGRAARALIEMTSGYQVDVPGLFKTFDGENYDEMIVERGIPFTSLCEHHMLPFVGHAHIGYIPDGKIVGLSKLGRVVEAYARRLQVQERLTVQIADAIETHLGAKGVIAVVEAEHSCMAVRGVRKPGVKAVTSALRGIMHDDHQARTEALTLIFGGVR